MFNKKNILTGIALGLVFLFVYLFTLPDGKLHIVFCNVGQGDAAYIRAPSNQDILIDGGPDSRVLNCLGRHMRFYDKTLDVVMLTHPQKDHLEGLLEVLARFKVKNFVIPEIGNNTEGYKKLVKLLKEKQIKTVNLTTGDSFSFGQTEMKILWPERKWLAENNSVLGLATSRDLNNFSYYLHLKYGQFDALFTGDGDMRMQPEILTRATLPQVEVLKYPHHGSKYGATEEFLEKVAPALAVISSGKNPWGHPNQETLDLLNEEKIIYKRTDNGSDVEVVSDGQKWWLAN